MGGSGVISLEIYCDMDVSPDGEHVVECWCGRTKIHTVRMGLVMLYRTESLAELGVFMGRLIGALRRDSKREKKDG